MSQRVVYLNGRFVPESEARLSIYDSALTLGDAAFEVTRTYAHRPFRLREHLLRLKHSLDVLEIGLPMPLDELQQRTLETLQQNLSTDDADVDWNIIHNVSRGPSASFREAFAAEQLRPTVVISCFPLLWKMAALSEDYESGVDLVVPRQRSLPASLLDASIKTRSRVHYQLANLQAERACPGATAILVDPEGFLTEGTSGNVFLVRDGRLVTPEARNLLAGVTRDEVIALAHRLGIPVREANVTPEEAQSAGEMFVTSTSIGIVHARSFAGRPVADGSLGPLTARLRAALIDEVGLDFVAQARRYRQRLEQAGP